MYSLVKLILKIPKLRGLLLRIFRKYWVIKIAKHFDIVDFHSFNSFYASIVNSLLKFDKKICVTHWGSDILRASDEEIRKQKRILKKVDQVRTISTEIHNKIQNLKINTKVFQCKFGVDGVDKIARFMERGNTNIATKNLKHIFPNFDFHNKKVIIIGNNGSKSQQHLEILRSLKGISEYLESIRCIFVIPLTYGIDRLYKKEIIEELDQLGVEHLLLDKYLNEEAFISLTILTDIYITMQTSDAFSFYLQEQLASGTIVLYGEWLSYSELTNSDVYMKSVNFDTISIRLKKTLINLNAEKELAKLHNKEKLLEISSWNNLSKKWFESYFSIYG
ncbi:MAG: hypothetical protein U5K72_12725 [Balneolaceae bacterium]|nr:hypothetical protein [Balneolaceae bacterium]